MRRLLSADAVRISRDKWFWICFCGMLAMDIAFMIMQHSAMGYTVPSMSFYGLAAAVMVSLFVGEDFSDGFIRNKIIAGHSRQNIFASNLIVVNLACIVIYLITTIFVAALGTMFFEIDITVPMFLKYLAMGIGMCLAYGSIYCTITMICTNKTTASVLCMAVAFALLCACLHTNQIMVQPEYKDGLANPAYVDGFVKCIYAFLHDLNPSGQAAQLSTMHIFHTPRWILCDLFWLLAAGGGCLVFARKNIQ